jgi:putative ABC transport system substrate-binding protein
MCAAAAMLLSLAVFASEGRSAWVEDTELAAPASYQGAPRTAPDAVDDVVADIATNPGVTVYKIPLALGEMLLASDASGPLKLVRNETSGPIAVIYPAIGEPYRTVFLKIIEGIEDKTRAPVVSIAVGADADAHTVANELRRQNVKVVIALGRHGFKVASGLDRNIGVVAGGVISVPDSEQRPVSVLSLAPDPSLMFARLKELMPAARRVHVVYDPRHNAWLLRLARDAARARALELVTYEAADLRSALRHYQDVLAAADPRTDALWLPQDATTVEESSVLPLVLEQAWNRSLLVFSSNVAHVQRGALFALYPDNVELGRNLASSALGVLGGGQQESRSMVPLKDVLLAVNIRTASHLGLRLSYDQQRRFNLIFPQQ